MRILLGILTALFLATSAAWAVDPSEMLSDPKAEARAEEVGKGLRCLVCQSESIEESNADLARDLRVIVRERITAGDSNSQVIDYVVSRYGDYVLLNPPFKMGTLLLWLGPLAFLGLGLMWAWSVFKKPETAASDPLTDEEAKQLKALVEKDKP
jgi:cytochrome c-type biogenesis protein CcmH